MSNVRMRPDTFGPSGTVRERLVGLDLGRTPLPSRPPLQPRAATWGALVVPNGRPVSSQRAALRALSGLPSVRSSGQAGM